MIIENSNEELWHKLQIDDVHLSPSLLQMISSFFASRGKVILRAKRTKNCFKSLHAFGLNYDALRIFDIANVPRSKLYDLLYTYYGG